MRSLDTWHRLTAVIVSRGYLTIHNSRATIHGSLWLKPSDIAAAICNTLKCHPARGIHVTTASGCRDSTVYVTLALIIPYALGLNLDRLNLARRNSTSGCLLTRNYASMLSTRAFAIAVAWEEISTLERCVFSLESFQKLLIPIRVRHLKHV